MTAFITLDRSIYCAIKPQRAINLLLDTFHLAPVRHNEQDGGGRCTEIGEWKCKNILQLLRHLGIVEELLAQKVTV